MGWHCESDRTLADLLLRMERDDEEARRVREERDALAQEVARLRTAREAAERTSQRLRGERNTLREERDSARRDLEVSRQHVAGWCLFRLRKFSSCAAVDALVADVRARNLELLAEVERGRDRLEETEAVVAEISRENSGLPQQLETATTTLSRLAEKDAEPLRKEDGASQGVEAEVAKSDDTDTDTDEDEEAVAARWNNGLGEPPIIFSQPHNWGTLFWVGWIPGFGEGLQRAPHRRCCRRSDQRWKLRVVRVLDLGGRDSLWHMLNVSHLIDLFTFY